MADTSSRFDTPLAIVERTGPDLIEVRFKPGVVLSIAGIGALLDARERMAGEGASRVLILFPAVEMDFDMAMITTDNYSGRPVGAYSKAVAWVTQNQRNDRFTRLYFAYFPSPVPSAIFDTEAEARAWLETQR